MKIRNGFVSNSSSSSFVLVGKSIGNILDDVRFFEEMDFESKEYVCFGGDLFEAQDVMELNKEMCEFIINNTEHFKNYDYFSGEVYELVIFSEDSSFFNVKELCEKGYEELDVMSGYCDYHSSRSIEDLIENYNIERGK